MKMQRGLSHAKPPGRKEFEKLQKELQKLWLTDQST
jgi:hypothetical protein